MGRVKVSFRNWIQGKSEPPSVTKAVLFTKTPLFCSKELVWNSGVQTNTWIVLKTPELYKTPYNSLILLAIVVRPPFRPNRRGFPKSNFTRRHDNNNNKNYILNNNSNRIVHTKPLSWSNTPSNYTKRSIPQSDFNSPKRSMIVPGERKTIGSIYRL